MQKLRSAKYALALVALIALVAVMVFAYFASRTSTADEGLVRTSHLLREIALAIRHQAASDQYAALICRISKDDCDLEYFVSNKLILAEATEGAYPGRVIVRALRTDQAASFNVPIGSIAVQSYGLNAIDEMGSGDDIVCIVYPDILPIRANR